MTAQTIYTVQVSYPDGRRLTWLHMCASISEALAWAKRRFPDSFCMTLGALQPQRPLAAVRFPHLRRRQRSRRHDAAA